MFSGKNKKRPLGLPQYHTIFENIESKILSNPMTDVMGFLQKRIADLKPSLKGKVESVV